MVDDVQGPLSGSSDGLSYFHNPFSGIEVYVETLLSSIVLSCGYESLMS